MTPLDAWVGRENVAKLKSQLDDPAFIRVAPQLTRLLAQAERDVLDRQLRLSTAADASPARLR
ncbi:MAG: hypothetical protein ABIO39_03540 [Caulobacteraceae bacterium]